MKKILAIFAIFVFGAFPVLAQDDLSQQGIPSVGQLSFSDVPGDHTFYHYIESLKEKGIISGYADGTFHPEWFVKRQEMAKFVVKGFELSLNVEQKKDCEQFSDVAKDNVFYEDILTLKCLGIVNGKSVSPLDKGDLGDFASFDPEAFVTRGEAMKFVIEAARVKKADENFLKHSEGMQNPFSDLDMNNVFYDYILDSYEYGIVEGKDGNFMTDEFFNRGGMGKVVYRSMLFFIIFKSSDELLIRSVDINGNYRDDVLFTFNQDNLNIKITPQNRFQGRADTVTVFNEGSSLTINLQSEGGSYGLNIDKSNVNRINNDKLTMPIYSIPIPRSTPTWFYTHLFTEYKPGRCIPEDEISNNIQMYCVFSGLSFNSQLLSIICEGNSVDTRKYCDNLVKSMNISVEN